MFDKLQARAPGSPVIVVGTHEDLVANKNDLRENLELISRWYGSLSHKVEGVSVCVCVCLFACLCVCLCACVCLCICLSIYLSLWCMVYVHCILYSAH